MSRPKYLWYDYVKKSILYSLGGWEGQAQSEKQKEKFDSALEKVLARTKGQYRGEERLEFIDLVYRRRRYNIPGAAMRLHISERVAQSWNREFVYAVAREMDFL